MGQVQFWDGKVLFVDGKVAMHPDCCCGCGECITCEGEQPAASVTITGCNETCDDGSGSYPWYYFTGNGDCSWNWGPHVVEYPPLTCTWYLGAFCIDDERSIGIKFWDEFDWHDVFLGRPEELTCDEESGHLTGTYILDGQAGTPCEGCTATVTFGG